jgi:hypothetical protein
VTYTLGDKAGIEGSPAKGGSHDQH